MLVDVVDGKRIAFIKAAHMQSRCVSVIPKYRKKYKIDYAIYAPEYKGGIYYHELYHILYGSMSDDHEIDDSRDICEELSADDYACEYVGASVYVCELEYLENMAGLIASTGWCKEDINSISCNELKARIQRLQ